MKNPASFFKIAEVQVFRFPKPPAFNVRLGNSLWKHILFVYFITSEYENWERLVTRNEKTSDNVCCIFLYLPTLT